MHSTSDLIKIALAEDIGSGDITTENAIPADAMGKGVIIAKEPLVLAGLAVCQQVFETVDSSIVFETGFNDGDSVDTGDTVLTISGSMRALLTGERTALNFLQHLSGIATQVRQYADLIKGTDIRLVDTRKTTPGLRMLEKYAVRAGGGHNHRTGLYDGVLIKDNHIAACNGIIPAVEKIRAGISHLVKIEVEAATMDEVKAAMEAGADVIMLDNMNVDQIKQAVALIDHQALVEISGNVTRENIADYAATGVDIISSGALTHSARSVDLSMRISPA